MYEENNWTEKDWEEYNRQWEEATKGWHFTEEEKECIKKNENTIN